MVIAFQIILLVIVFLSATNVLGEKENKSYRDMVMGVLLAGLASFIVSVMWL